MIKFIVIEKGSGDFFIVDNLEKLIEEMYDGEYNEDSFYRGYSVIEVKGEFEIKEY